MEDLKLRKYPVELPKNGEKVKHFKKSENIYGDMKLEEFKQSD